jgi:hypothetical protein
VADLGLREVLVVAQVQDLALAGRELAQERGEGGPLLDEPEAVVVAAQPRLQRLIAVLVGTRRQRRRAARPQRPARLGDLRLVQPGRAGQLLHAGGPAELALHPLGRTFDRERLLEQVARRADAPAVVAEVAAHLAGHRRERVAGERRAMIGVEPVDGLQEPDARDLEEVVEAVAAVGVATRDEAGEAQVAADELLAQLRVACAGEAAQQRRIVVDGGGLRGVRHVRTSGGTAGPTRPRPAGRRVVSVEVLRIPSRWWATCRAPSADERTHAVPRH